MSGAAQDRRGASHSAANTSQACAVAHTLQQRFQDDRSTLTAELPQSETKTGYKRPFNKLLDAAEEEIAAVIDSESDSAEPAPQQNLGLDSENESQHKQPRQVSAQVEQAGAAPATSTARAEASASLKYVKLRAERSCSQCRCHRSCET